MKRSSTAGAGLVGAMLAVGIVAAPLPSGVQAQQPPRAVSRGAGPQGNRMFDPSTVTTVSGAIESVQTSGGRRAHGVLLTLSTGSEKLQVVVGPSFYVDRQPVKLAQGDRVEVKGSRTSWGGQPVIIAQEIRKGDQVLALRDASGIPLWSRARGRR